MTEDVSEDELYEVFKEQVDAIKDAGADGIVIETMSDLAEAKIALKAAKESGLPVVVSMAFDSGKNKEFTYMGHPPEEVAEELTKEGADAIGANCGQGIEGFVNICKRLESFHHSASLDKTQCRASRTSGESDCLQYFRRRIC